MKQNINTLKVNEKNPRTITGQKIELLVDSVLSFPKMLSLRPIVIDNDGTVLGGNMRTRALTQISQMSFSAIRERLMLNRDFSKMPDMAKNMLYDYWEKWLEEPDVVVVKASELTEEEKHRFIIEDNASFGQWDYDALANEWDVDDLTNWGINMSFLGVDDGKTWDALGAVEGNPPEPTLNKGVKIQVVIAEEMKDMETEVRQAIEVAIAPFEGCEIK